MQEIKRQIKVGGTIPRPSLVFIREHSVRKQVHRRDRGKIGSVFLFTVSFDYFSFDLIDKKYLLVS
jgi:hypothetical protein